jgi:NAD-dependent DNA ligase
LIDDIKLQQALAKRQLNKGVEMLLGLVTGMLADGHLHELEIKMLNTWLSENAAVSESWPGSFVALKLKNILNDGLITEPERLHFQEALQQLATNDFSDTGSTSPEVVSIPLNDDGQVFLRDATICLTGNFLFGTRNKCEEVSTLAGATPRSTITNNLDFLVIGTHVSPNWVHTSFGRKIQQAVEMQQAGKPIKIISERRWQAALNNTSTAI